MSYFEAFLYGLVQGITEYLPISSSAHLILLPEFLGAQDFGLAFDLVLHLGTLLATVIYFWKDWLAILSQIFPSLLKRLDHLPADVVSWKAIVIGTLPALIAGAFLHQWISTVFRGNLILIFTLSGGGGILFLVDYYFSKNRSIKEIGYFDAFFIGVAQCFALVPGVSRSGSTIIGGRLLGYDRAASAHFSFLLSAPVTAAAIVFESQNWSQLFDSGIECQSLLLAVVSSFLFGLLAIGGLLRIVRKFSYLGFAVYRVLLAIVIWRMFVM